jgi:cell division septation protein DedD
MTKIRHRAAGAFALVALAVAVAPVASAGASPDPDCIKRAIGAEIHHIVDGGPVPLPCG